MKRKLLLPILSVCMVVALVSVGFAAWLITGADTSDDAQGQFITYGVDNEYFTVKITPTQADDAKIVFGRPASSTAKNSANWFQWENVAEQNLSKEFTVTVTFDDLSDKDSDNTVDLDDAKEILKKWDITLNMITADKTTGDNKDAYKKATDSKYIAEPKFFVNYVDSNTAVATVTEKTILGTLRPDGKDTGEIGGMKLTITDWKGTGTDGAIATENGKYFVQAKVKVEFYWGTYFGKDSEGVTTNTNPETYFLGANFADKTADGKVTGYEAGGSLKYDALDNNAKAALRTEAQKVMEAINNLSNQQFTIYLGATSKTTTNS